MKLKRISIRFNMEHEADRKAWEFLQGVKDSKNKAVIAAINSYFEPVNFSVVDIIRQTIRDCLQNISVVQLLPTEQTPTLTEDENALLDSLDDFLGG